MDGRSSGTVIKWTIVVPTWRRPGPLEETLRGLFAQEFRDFEVVVVCDGPDADYRDVRARFEDGERLVWLTHAENKGMSAARNSGAACARGEYLLFLDDDVLAGPQLLARHDARHAAARGKLVVFGRTIEDRRVPFASNTDRRMQQSWERFLAQYFPFEPRAADESVGDAAERAVFFGLNCSLRRDEFLREGGFDERLRSDEDNEMGWRLYRRGYRFAYVPDASIVHANSRNMAHYFPACWARSGGHDVYRVRELGQRGAQTAQLAAGRHGSAGARCAAAISWRWAPAMLRASRLLEALTDATDSRISFALWARMRRVAEYWRAVRRTGVTARELHELAGPVSRILMFHSLSLPQSPAEARFYLPAARFRRVLSTCRALGLSFAHPDAYAASPAGMVLTFDDAYDDLHEHLIGAMREFDIAPLVFVVADRIGGENDWDQRQGLRARRLATLSQLRELQRAGAVIGCHSMTHRSLRGLPARELATEVRDAKSRLEDLFGCAVNWFAYPYGHCDRAARAAVAEAGYRAAVTAAPGLNRWTDPLALNRIEIHSEDRVWDMLGKLATGKDVRAALAVRLKRMRRYTAPSSLRG